MNRHAQQGGKIIAGVLIALLVLIALAVAAVIAGGWYLAHNLRVEETSTERGKSVAIQTPIGSLRVQEGRRLDPAKAGVPVYPGARIAEGDSRSVSLDLEFGSERKEVAITTARYATDDSVERVADFYRKELPHWIISKSWRGVRMEYSEKGYQRFIAIAEKRGRTHIVVAQIGEPPTL